MEHEELSVDEAGLPPSPQKKGNAMLLIIIQLIVCTLIVLGAFIVKLIGGEAHAAVGTWFYDNYNNTVFIGEVSRIQPMKDPVTVSEVSTPVPENSTAEKKDKAPEKSEVSG